jgi:hypothetical protein
MAANNGFPSMTTAGQGLFNGPSSVGLIQGQAFPDPSTRFALRSAVVSQNETIPMWGGVGVYADISPISTTGPRQPLGQVVGRANSMSGSTALVGFTVFDQGYNGVSDPNNPVTTYGSGQSVNYYALGSRARIAVACDQSLISLRGGEINQSVSWDFVSQQVVPYVPAYTAVTITGAVWASTSGGQITFTVGTDLTSKLSAGSDIEVTGVVSTGGTGGSFNGMWTVVSVTSTTVVVVALAASGFYGTYSSGGTITAGGGALPVTVLDIQPAGCMTVNYSAVTGYTTWNFSGACAIIQLTGGTVA